MDLPQTLKLAGLLLFALLANLPLGFLREGSSKYSFRWFLYIHLSIPFIILLRLQYGFGWKVLPLTIACAVGGQILGGRMKRRRPS